MDDMIVFQDKSIIVCIKPVGTESEGEGMPGLLREKCNAREVFCVHRLDKGVGGVMVYAKTGKAAAALSKAIAEGRLVKEYLAVVSGRPEEDIGTYRDMLYHDSGKNKSFVVNRERRGVKKAELDYSVRQSAQGMSLVHITLRTGRSHQIRVQFASRKMPLAGDVKYGSTVRSCPIALFASRLSFPHPVTGETMTFEALPECRFPWNCFL